MGRRDHGPVRAPTGHRQWPAAPIPAYQSLSYLDDLRTVKADIEGATAELVADLDELACRGS